MFYQRLATASAFALVFAGEALRAQPVPAEAAPPPAAEMAPASPCCTVPARTIVQIEISDTVNSKASRTGQSFAFRLAEPIVVDGQIVAPAGTPGVGEVVHAARARAGGKAGELILAARYLDLNGTRLPLRSLRYGRSQGADNSGAVAVGGMVAAAVLPVASVLGYLIAGGEVNIPAGTRAHAQTSAEITIAPAQ